MTAERDEVPTLLAELEGIRTLLRHAAAAGRTAFSRDSVSYAAGALAVIRLQSLLEDRRFGVLHDAITPAEARGVRVTRNIAARVGMEGVNDEEFWVTTTERMPDLIDRLIEAVGDGRARPD